MIKSVLMLSVILNTLGFSGLSAKIDQSVLSETSSQAVVASANITPLPEIAIPPKIDENAPDANIYAQNYILFDADSSTILEAQAATVRVPIASTTKIMTATIILENYNLNDVVTVSAAAAGQTDAGGLHTGEKITVMNLLKCMLIVSANGAAYALAEHYNTGSETGITKFVQAMNDKAKLLGMKDTDYHDSSGLDTSGYSTAYDLTLATKYALKNTIFDSIVTTKTEIVTDITGSIHHDLKNSNRLVADWNYPGILGVKTGYMPEASHCLVAAATRGGHTLISIILHTNADTAEASALESRKLLDWGFANTIYQ